MSFERQAPDEDLFGPGTDLMLSLVAVLALLVVAFSSQAPIPLEANSESASTVVDEQDSLLSRLALLNERQLELIQAIAIATQLQLFTNARNADTFTLATAETARPDVTIVNSLTLQRFSFENHLLFEENEHHLLTPSKRMLRLLTRVIQPRLDYIEEIQIQAHADPRSTSKYASNLHLASERALSVFHFLQQESGIDPTQSLMSATSFGEYVPSTRNRLRSFDRAELDSANQGAAQWRLNRRTEIVLIYRFPTQAKELETRAAGREALEH